MKLIQIKRIHIKLIQMELIHLKMIHIIEMNADGVMAAVCETRQSKELKLIIPP